MSTHQAILTGSIIAFILSLVGAMAAQAKIVKGVKDAEAESNDRSLYNLMFVGIAFVEILPLLTLILLLILLLKK